MDRKRKYIDSPCIKYLVSKGRIPMLFVGSGLSKRYLDGYPSWDELIYYVAEKIGVSKGQLIAMKQEVTDSMPAEPKSRINAEVGSRLTKIFREKVLKGEIKLEDIFTPDEIERIEKENITFVKMLISKKLSEYNLVTYSKYVSELNELRKLQGNIGAVVTTNYDRFLEKEVFNNFDVFVDQSQYYMTECTGIGEIYKIHGSVESPNSLVFNSEDYENFNNNLRVIAAKLLNLALEYPIIFLGYSLEDENVLAVLETLIEALNEEQLKQLSKNLIYVEWKPREELLRERRKIINRTGKSLEMICISTDNYFVLYKHLLKFVPSEKPERVRKYKKMIQNLILSNNRGNATIIANENLDKLNSDGKLVIAFGEVDSFAHMGIVGLHTEEIMKWVLEQRRDITEKYANAVFEEFYCGTNIPSSNYVPMFYLFRFTSNYHENEKLLIMKENLIKWVDGLANNEKIKIYENYNELIDDIDNVPVYRYIENIVKTYNASKIDYEECLSVLKVLNSREALLKDSSFRKAITFLDMKE